MKEKTTHIKNKYTKSNIIDIISMVILIYIICHFLIVVPMFYTGSNDSIFRKLYLIRSFVLAAPVQLWYILAKYKEYKDNKKNSTYIKVSGIEYFRNKLKGLNPAMISFLVNLSLEQEKDTKAMILYYQKNNILSDDLKVDLSNPLLKDSDKAFFKYLESYSNSDYQSWEKSIQEEAISNQYVKRNNQDYFYQERLKVIAFMILSVVIFIISFKYFDYQLSTFGPLNISINGEILRRLPMVIAFILMLLSGFNVWLIIRTGPSKIVKYYNKAGIFVRTRKGDKLTEEIHSIKRFIHDFSILEESTKKNLVLWDDFLLYAVVLEENTIILDEIQTYKNSTILK